MVADKTDRDMKAVVEVLADVGVALLHIQLAESVIKKVLHFVLPAKPIKNTKGFMRAEEALTKQTLGTLAKILKERADLHPRFEVVMERFVEDRNTLVHHLDDIPGFNDRSKEGQAQARIWLAELVNTTDLVVKIFMALMVAYSEQLGNGPAAPDGIRDYIGEDVIEMVDVFFRAKD